MEPSLQFDHTHRKKFPLGYLLHPWPVLMHDVALNDNDGSCAQILAAVLFSFYLRSASRSYLKTGPGGLEFHLDPAPPLAVPWSDVLRLEYGRFLGIPYETLFIDRPYAAVFPRPLYLRDEDRRRYEASRLGIPLWQFEGWPAGQLAVDLMHYIPEVIGAPVPGRGYRAGTG